MECLIQRIRDRDNQKATNLNNKRQRIAELEGEVKGARLETQHQVALRKVVEVGSRLQSMFPMYQMHDFRSRTTSSTARWQRRRLHWMPAAMRTPS